MSLDLTHGGALDAMRAAFPIAPNPWIDLSTGINPWPYPDIHTSQAAFAGLPTRTEYEACRNAMAAAIGISPESLLLAPGSELLIRLLPDAIGPRRVAILSPTYGDHIDAWRRAGADIFQTSDPLSYADRADAVIVTHPNNPDGRVFDADALETARRTLSANGGWLIIDEAYADLVPDRSLAFRSGADGLIILRSFGKFFGLAGVRLGALIAPQPVYDAVNDRLGVWPISGSALEIGTRCYADTEWQVQTRERLAQASKRLDTLLRHCAVKVIGGTHLYRYVQVASADDVFQRLAHKGIYVRRFAWSETELRIGLPSNLQAENRLAAALKA
ncbi:MAG: threonine-phosphate decarboxylase CobD [Pseudomonadota bacterium]